MHLVAAAARGAAVWMGTFRNTLSTQCCCPQHLPNVHKAHSCILQSTPRNPHFSAIQVHRPSYMPKHPLQAASASLPSSKRGRYHAISYTTRQATIPCTLAHTQHIYYQRVLGATNQALPRASTHQIKRAVPTPCELLCVRLQLSACPRLCTATWHSTSVALRCSRTAARSGGQGATFAAGADGSGAHALRRAPRRTRCYRI